MGNVALIPGLGLAEMQDIALRFVVAMLRIGAFLVASPVFGGRYTPLPVRIVAGVMLAIPVVQHVPPQVAARMADLSGVILIMGEITLGLTAGLVLSILFAAAATAGDRIASTAGLGFAAQFDPAGGGQTPVVSQLFTFFLLLLFLAADGHLAALRIVLESYADLPPGQMPDAARLIGAGVIAGGRMFALAMSIMLPVVVALLLLNVAIGVITRSAPQMNIFSFGFPLTMSATLVLLYVAAPGTANSLNAIVDEALLSLRSILAAKGG